MKIKSVDGFGRWWDRQNVRMLKILRHVGGSCTVPKDQDIERRKSDAEAPEDEIPGAENRKSNPQVGLGEGGVGKM